MINIFILCDNCKYRNKCTYKNKIQTTDTLECSSKGCKHFSAFYAYIKSQSIENWYQLSKRFGDYVPRTWRDSKGKKPTHLHIGGKDYNLKYTKAFYELMWVKYLDNKPMLVKFAKQFDKFNDIFKSKNAVVCQADVIKKYIKNGRESIINEHKEFLDLIKNS